MSMSSVTGQVSDSSVIFFNKVPFIEIAIAILFNPIYPIYMDKSSWVIFDIICGIYYIYLFYKESK